MVDKRNENRQLKIVCPSCGAIYRASKYWIEQGLPTCQCGTRMIVPVPSSQINRYNRLMTEATQSQDLLTQLLNALQNAPTRNAPVTQIAPPITPRPVTPPPAPPPVQQIIQAQEPDHVKRALERWLTAKQSVGDDHEVTRKLKDEYEDAVEREKRKQGGQP